jgi:predicted transcriptional regulator
MPLIPARQVEPRETLTCRVDRSIHEQLKEYAAFIDSPKEYVVAQALERLFRSDKEFVRWLAMREDADPEETRADPSEERDESVARSGPDRRGGR